MNMHWRTARKVVGENQPSGPHYAPGAQRISNSSADDRELAALLFASVVFGAPLIFGLTVYLLFVA